MSTDNLNQHRSNTPCISIDNLHYSYAGAAAAALHNIHLYIKPGTILGLLGPNGAGKTTLISLLAGVLPVPKEARITVQGYDAAKQRKKVRALSALVPQDYAFYPMLTGRENLQHFCSLYGQCAAVAKQRIAYCVQVCSLHDVIDRRASQYSGGVKRRLNLAIGLLNKPQVLYLDEPTVGIDAQSRHFILQAITGLKNQGITIIYTSHYMDEVQMICDDIAVIDHGRVIVSDSLASLLNKNTGAQLLIDIAQPLPESIHIKLQHYACVPIDCQHLSIDITAGTHNLIALLSLLQGEGIHVVRMHSPASKLEQVYLSLTRQELRD